MEKLLVQNWVGQVFTNESNCVLIFVKHLYNRNPSYSQELFDYEYVKFEDYFYSQ
jgi:hypothetical protein